MSIPNEPGKVVDLQQRQGAQQFGGERLADLYKSARMAALKRLNQLASETFEKIDDALFDLAEKSETSVLQTKYFDGMREVRRKRPEMERIFQESFQSGFNDPQRLQSGSGAGGSDKGSALSELSLIGETELEETLALGSMVGKAENRLARGLYALSQRISVVLGGAKIADEDNPFGPRAITRAFKSSLAILDTEIEVKLFILKLFDKYVMAGLDIFYDEINQVLMDGGVLPQLKHQVGGVHRRAGPAVAPGMAQPGEMGGVDQAQGMADGGGSMLPPHGGAMLPPGASGMPMMGGMPMGMGGGGFAQQGGDTSLQWELYNTLRALMSQRHPQSQQTSGGPTYGTNELLNALSLLQNQNVGQGGGLNFLGGGPSLGAIQQIKDDLISQVGKLSGGADTGQRVASADEDTIDLVGMLFEYILQDRNLPAEIQALLARLQIPYLKAAILDKHLFAKKEHPARRLLDELAQAGVSWTEEGDKDRRLFEKIKQIVETLLREFDDNVGIFERLLKEFAEFVSSTRKRSDIAEQRTTEAARGREKLQNARKTAAKEILSRMEGKRLPEVIRHILTRPWANVLVLTLLRQGEATPQWTAALRVADELVWSTLPKDNPPDKARLRALGPELDKALRQGLSLVAYPDADVQQLLHELGQFRISMLEPGKVPAPVVIESLGDDDEANELIIENKSSAALQNLPSAREESFVEELAGRREMPAEAEDEDGEQGPEDDYVAMARNVKVGVWVEFRDSSGGVERAKLSWVSPISSKFLFVNRKGLKVADKTVWGLAAELRKGMAVILEDVPLFDRALDAIVERLKSGGHETSNDLSSDSNH